MLSLTDTETFMEPKQSEPTRWTSAQKIAFRFLFIYFLLYIFVNPNGAVPLGEALYKYYSIPFHNIAVWMGAHLLNLAKPITVFTNGSGDTTYDYVIILLDVILSAAGTIIWSITGKRTAHYNKLYYWFTTVLRYYILLTMFSYGMAKVIKLQFPYPGPGRLLQTYGESSPMGLAWTFFGYSTWYNYFTGFAELLGCVLLFFRRTYVLGAVVTFIVAANIMAINYCFDVPVKLLSTHLVLMSLVLLSKHLVRLLNFFFLNKTALPADLTPHRFRSSWKNITLLVVRFLLIVYMIMGVFETIGASKQYGDKAPKAPLYGAYEVITFKRNKDTLPPLTTDTLRWKVLIINYAGNARIKMMNDSTRNYEFNVDTTQKNIQMTTSNIIPRKYFLTYRIIKPNLLQIKGTGPTDSINITLKRLDPNNFLLTRRGFHWVNEYPFSH